MNIDPTTNKPLPADAIQRILYITPKVHIYAIPPMQSTRGFAAASWTTDPKAHIFTARLRIIETALSPSASSSSFSSASARGSGVKEEEDESVSVTILLEDPGSGELFAAAPYGSPGVVEQATDSSRFFAVRVVGEGGRKATLGLGFEERPEAFDFGVALQDVRRTLKMDAGPAAQQSAGSKGAARGVVRKMAEETHKETFKDLSLKEGEMITINIGGKGKRHAGEQKPAVSSGGNPFAIAPPPSSGASKSQTSSMAFLPPPPSAAQSRDKRKSMEASKAPSAEDLGFDDGEFGEFQ